MYAENLHHSVAPSPSCILPSDTRANTRQSGRIHAALLPTSRKIASLPRQRAIRPSHAVPCHLALILAQKCDAAEATRYSPFSRSTLRSYSAGSERLCASMAESLSGAVDETGGCAARRDVAAFLFASLVCPPPLARLGACRIVRGGGASPAPKRWLLSSWRSQPVFAAKKDGEKRNIPRTNSGILSSCVEYFARTRTADSSFWSGSSAPGARRYASGRRRARASAAAGCAAARMAGGRGQALWRRIRPGKVGTGTL